MITVVRNIGQLVTPRGAEPSAASAELLRVSQGESIVIRDDRIASIDSRPPSQADRTVDAAGAVVLPGLIDPCVSLLVAGSTTNLDASPPRRRRIALECLLRHGTTSVEVRAVAGDPTADVAGALAEIQQLSHRVALRLAMAFLAAPPPPHDDRADRISGVIGETIPSLSRRRLASTCVALCGKEGYSRKEAREVLRAARGAGFEVKVQACEPEAEAALVAAELGASTIDHLSASPLGSRSLALLRKAGTIPILLPTVCFTSGQPADARAFVDAGLPVALSASADVEAGGVFSQWTAIALAVRRFGLSLEEAIVAATLNSAVATGVGDTVGTLEPGKLADFVLLDIDDYRRIPDFVVGLPIRSVFVGGKEVLRG